MPEIKIDIDLHFSHKYNKPGLFITFIQSCTEMSTISKRGICQVEIRRSCEAGTSGQQTRYCDTTFLYIDNIHKNNLI